MQEPTTPPAPAPTPTPADGLLAPALFGGVILGVVLLILWRTGVLSRRAFADAPMRRGGMGLADIFVTIGLYFLAAVAFAPLLGPPGDGDPGAAETLRRLAVSQLMMLVPVGYVLFRAATVLEGGLASFGLGVSRPGRLLRAIGLGTLAIIPLVFSLGMLVAVIATLAGDPPPAISHGALKVLAETPPGPLLYGMIASAVLGAPLLEEILFRGLFQTALLNTGFFRSRWGVIIAASLLFTPVHLGAVTWHALPVLFILSLGLGFGYERTGSLWVPIGMHALFNGVQVSIVLSQLTTAAG